MRPFATALFFVTVFTVLFFTAVSAASTPSGNRSVSEEELPKLHNPVNEEYLKKNLRKSLPRLVLNKEIEKDLRKKLTRDPLVQNYYQAIRLNATGILDEPLLERIQIGRRLLSVSREMLYRINMLGMVYFIEKDPVILRRINEEVVAVCQFSDWNPSHFLDVAEMSMAVALALDWTAGKLPRSTIRLAQTSLIEKGINPSWPEDGKTPGWVNGTNNWNQVCNGGMIAASIAVADIDPVLAAKTIYRALDGIPHALTEYRPHGVYPEGSTYWSYGTSFSVITAAMLESAFGTDFGHSEYPGFMESATFRVLTNAPSGMYYNFADCGETRSEQGDITLAWFAAKTGIENYFERERFLMPAESMGELARLAGAALVWISQYEKQGEKTLPVAWRGEGANPVLFFTGGENDPRQYYFGGKGGRGMVNHGNMDGGSFVFELDGVRWVVDPGNQDYNQLEQLGFNLWGRCQECERWTLLTKNNFGHSTLTVNDQLHRTEGLATIIDFKEGEQPEATIDLTPTFMGQLKSARRRFVKDTPVSLTIQDMIEVLDSTEVITWQLLTTADVNITREGATLIKNGKSLKLENHSHPQCSFSVVSLYPAPLEIDRQIRGLKRVELRIPAWTIKGNRTQIEIRLTGEETE